MIQLIVAVRDVKVGAFGRPMFVASSGSAIRSFSDEVNRKHEENMLYNHPSDFALYELGKYEDNDGIITPSKLPTLLIQADQVKIQTKSDTEGVF
ncbi:MAG: nonstructural protein [Microvirus sp.]|nr:MAG: nonstructural protein [Microvirus sp.]